MKSFAVGVDSYSLEPLGLSAFGLLEWVRGHGGEGVQFSGGARGEGGKTDPAFLRDLAAAARDLGLYLEWGGGRHIPYDQWNGWQPLDVVAVNRLAAEQASLLGCSVVRSCSGGLMRWNADAPATGFLLAETAKALKAQRKMLEENGVTLAIETHFEFTTFELRRLFEMCEASPGGYLGICLDTMNLLTMLENPLQATERILPWVVATHFKDGGVASRGKGLISFPAAIGSGLIDLAAIIAKLARLDRGITLSIEDHGGSFEIPVADANFLSRFPDLDAAELDFLQAMAAAADRRIAAGSLSIRERSEWPGLCAAQVEKDIARLKELAKAVEG